jgi:Holliday junction resolvase RusA-like endonuclease
MIEWDHHLIIFGNPKAMGRPRAVKRGKFAGVHEDPKDTKNKETLAVIAQQKSPDELLAGPLLVSVHFWFQRPKSHYGTGKNSGLLKDSAPKYHTSRPDRDNLDKLVLDALTGIFWKDDSTICQGSISKMYSERPRTEIFIKSLSPAQRL